MGVPYKLYNGDCLEVMPSLPAGSVDAIITDLPYGTTAIEWDSILPLAPMWEQVKRVLKPNGVFITTASQPFTTVLISSNMEWFRYEMIFSKSKATGFLDANRKPLKAHENILVFGKGKITYNPQMVKGKVHKNGGKSRGKAHEQMHGKFNDFETVSDKYYPKSIVEFTHVVDAVHPTQKPVSLYAYLVRTYTNLSEVVLDITMGSGTTGVACVQEGREFIGIEKEQVYFSIAEKRIGEAAQQPALFYEAQQSVQPTAFGAGGRGSNSLQSNFLADESSATHGGG